MEKLIDTRARITPLSHAVIEAIHRHEGRDHSEIIREVLHEWALREAGKASLVAELAAREGFGAASQGTSGKQSGTTRSGRE